MYINIMTLAKKESNNNALLQRKSHCCVERVDESHLWCNSQP